jgi:transglutaminase-like putative cysteine protease
MSTPRFLLAAAALLWAWQSGGGIHWAVALVAAALLEGPRFTAKRWNLSTADFNRVSDFCFVLALALGAYLYFTFGNPRAITLLFQWLPIVLLPLALSQAWSTSSGVDLGVIFRALRRAKDRRPSELDLAWPCFALWLLAASAANNRAPVFYAGLVLLCAWAAAPRRPKSFSFGAWAGLVLLAAALGYAGQHGLQRFQEWLEDAAPEWLAGGSGARTDPYRSVTDIGTLGEIKSSDAIVLRVERSESLPAPLLLHRASYDDYAGRAWLARGGRFDGVAPEPGGRWTLQDATPRASLLIHDYSPAGNPVLSLPQGTTRLEGLPVLGLRRNTLGAVQAERPPGYFSYTARVDATRALEAPPTAMDLRLASAEAEVIRRVATEWNLHVGAPAETVQRLRERLASGFSYALYRAKAADDPSPLVDFLTVTRAGHCEYFATATVLLLRAAGIPARYATGFSVHEYSRLEGAYVVRERHAHSWARAWVEGRWIDVDTTPASWASVEAARSGAWSGVRDAAAWARFALSRWLSRLDDEQTQRWGLAAAFVLAAFIAWRVLRRRQSASATRGGTQGRMRGASADESPFYGIERRLGELGWRREAHETLRDWLVRIAENAPPGLERVNHLARLHSRLRFDPAGLSEDERRALARGAADWMSTHGAR